MTDTIDRLCKRVMELERSLLDANDFIQQLADHTEKVEAELIALKADRGDPAAWLHIQGNYVEPSPRQLDQGERDRGWTEQPLYK